MPADIRLAIVGAGIISDVHARAIRAARGADLTAIVDIELAARAAAERFDERVKVSQPVEGDPGALLLHMILLVQPHVHYNQHHSCIYLGVH